MAGFKFEGLTDGIQPCQLEFIEQVLKELGCDKGIITVEVAGKLGDNYAAEVRRFTIEKDGKPFRMFGKITTGSKRAEAAFGLNHLFANEHLMYTIILPKYSELEDAAGVPEKDRFRYAKCYGSFTKESSQVILLEDLNVTGFTMYDKFKTLPEEAVRLILKDFAAMNALSYTWKALEPETYREQTLKLYNVFNKDSSLMKQLNFVFSNLEREAPIILQKEKHKKHVRNIRNLLHEAVEETHQKHYEQYHVIQQGDCWSNNIMFRIEDNDPVQGCMVDYQVSRLTSPVDDLSYFIFNCTDYEMRMKHFYEWIDYYYSQLEKFLSYHRLEAKDVYPRERFDEELKNCGKLTLVLGILVSSLIFREGADAEKLKATIHQSEQDKLQEVLQSNKLSAMKLATVAKFRQRMEELIDSLLELGLIPA